MMVIVHSHYKNIAKRNAIRATWASYVQQGKWVSGRKLSWNIKVAFLFGKSVNDEYETGLTQEANDKKDIIQEILLIATGT